MDAPVIAAANSEGRFVESLAPLARIVVRCNICLMAPYAFRIPVDHGDLIVRLVTWAMKGTDEASAD